MPVEAYCQIFPDLRRASAAGRMHTRSLKSESVRGRGIASALPRGEDAPSPDGLAFRQISLPGEASQ
jgi:hypothetical protein